jgi:hypothetical protein
MIATVLFGTVLPLVTISVWAILATAMAVARDGYRRIPYTPDAPHQTLRR